MSRASRAFGGFTLSGRSRESFNSHCERCAETLNAIEENNQRSGQRGSVTRWSKAQKLYGKHNAANLEHG